MRGCCGSWINPRSWMCLIGGAPASLLFGCTLRGGIYGQLLIQGRIVVVQTEDVAWPAHGVLSRIGVLFSRPVSGAKRKRSVCDLRVDLPEITHDEESMANRIGFT